MWASGFIFYAVLYFIFRKNRVTKEEAELSNPPSAAGLTMWPKRNEGDVKIPRWALILLLIWMVISLIIDLQR